eukprot:RCo003231
MDITLPQRANKPCSPNDSDFVEKNEEGAEGAVRSDWHAKERRKEVCGKDTGLSPSSLSPSAWPVCACEGWLRWGASVVEGEDARHSAADPVRHRLRGGDLNRHHVVRRVPGRAQGARPPQRLIARRQVDPLCGGLAVDLRLQPHRGHLGEQLLGEALRDHPRPGVPPGALHVHPVDVHPVLGLLLQLRRGLGQENEREADRVDADLALPGEVLEGASEEGLGKEEPADPERRRGTAVEPPVDELAALHQVRDPRGQGLQRGVGLVRPSLGHLVVEQAVGDVLELLRHNNQALHGALEVRQAGVDCREQAAETDPLLHQHRVQALVVPRGVLRGELPEIEGLPHLRQHLLCDLRDGFVLVLASYAGRLGLHLQDGPQGVIGLRPSVRDIGVLVQPKGLRFGVDRPPLHHLQVPGVVRGGDSLVQPAAAEGVTLGQHGGGDEELQHGHQGATIPVVRHAAPVVDLPRQECDDLVRDVVVLVQEALQLPHTDVQVGHRELVADVPPQRPKLAALLDQRVEEAQCEEHLLEHRGLLAALQEVRGVRQQ